jgi:hypothetical protein
MTNPLYVVQTLIATVADAMHLFDERYILVTSAEPQPEGLAAYGEVIPVDSPSADFLIADLGVQFQKTQGESRYKSLGGSKFTIRTEEFDEGVVAKFYDLTKNAFYVRKWEKAPERLLMAEQDFIKANFASVIENGTTLIWEPDGKAFWATDHACNPSDPSKGTFSNYQATPKDLLDMDDLMDECVAFQENAKDENGNRVESEVDTIFAPTRKYRRLIRELGKDFIQAGNTVAMTNPFTKNEFTVVHVPQFASNVDFVLHDAKRAKRMGLPPLIALHEKLPPELELRRYGEDSEYFKDTGYVKVSKHIQYGFGPGFPQTVRYVEGE